MFPAIDVLLLPQRHDSLWPELLQQGRCLPRQHAGPLWVPEWHNTVRARLEPALLPGRFRLQPGMSTRLKPERQHRLPPRWDDLHVGTDHEHHGAVQPRHGLHESR